MEAFSSGLFKSVGNKVRQFAFNLTETELKAEEATNSDKWGPHGSLMAELAEMCYDPSKYKEIMQVLARRLTDTGEDWRHVYKALLVMEYLVKHGPMKVVHELQGNLSFLEELQSFKYKDKAGKDHGLNVRNRAKTLAMLVGNQERVLQERENAQRNKSKYSGSSRDDMMFNSRSPRMGGNYGGFGSDSRGFGGSSEGFGGNTKVSSPSGYALPESPIAPNDDDNPFEATRKRIEKLKGEGQTEGEPQHPVGVALDTMGGAGLNSPKAPKKEPKKLSQVKVNPEIAAAFSKMHVTPVAPRGPPISLGGAAVGSGGNHTIAPAENDLLGGLDDPPSNNTIPADLLGAGLDALEISPTPPASGGNSQANDGWSAFESGPTGTQQTPADPFAQMSAGGNLGQAPAPTSDPFAALSGGGQQPVSPMGAPKAAAAPLPDFFTESPNPPAQPAMHSMGGVGGGPSAQGNNFAAQNPPNPMGGMNMNMNANAGGGNGGFGGQMGNWSNSNPGFTQAPAYQMSQGTGAQGSAIPGVNPVNPVGFSGMAGPTGAGGMGGGGFGNFNSAPPVAVASPSPVPGGQMQTNHGTSDFDMGGARKGGSAPMRPGASRPVATRKKDPFADLGVL